MVDKDLVQYRHVVDENHHVLGEGHHILDVVLFLSLDYPVDVVEVTLFILKCSLSLLFLLKFMM